MKNLFMEVIDRIKKQSKAKVTAGFKLSEIDSDLNTDISKWSVADMNCTRAMFSDDVVIKACDKFEKISEASKNVEFIL